MTRGDKLTRLFDLDSLVQEHTGEGHHLWVATRQNGRQSIFCECGLPRDKGGRPKMPKVEKPPASNKMTPVLLEDDLEVDPRE